MPSPRNYRLRWHRYYYRYHISNEMSGVLPWAPVPRDQTCLNFYFILFIYVWLTQLRDNERDTTNRISQVQLTRHAKRFAQDVHTHEQATYFIIHF